ncbi:hypothetical protein [Neoroseomonas rubea]|uniref:hypothetical protein n=1 Tax=Neoroseomonas rubea TaxID=2748666 RepID=UPI0018DF8CF3|nr:hypothetical protein [Roseomonas rubea]
MSSNANTISAIGGAASGLARTAKEAASTDIAALRDRVEALMRDRISPALADAADRTEDVAQGAVDSVRRQGGALLAAVRVQPVAAIGAAALAGLALGLLLRR